MTNREPSFFLLIPGAWSTTEALMTVLQPLGVPIVAMDGVLTAGSIAVDVVHDEGGFGDAVGYMPGFITDGDIAACARTPTAAIIEVSGRLDEHGTLVGALASLLHANGALAIRFEASGKAHAIASCARVLATGDLSDLLQLALVYSFDGEQYFSIGMQQFDLPDIEVSGVDGDLAGHWVHTFCMFTVNDKPILGDGHTFGPDADSPRQSLERWPDLRHGAEDGRQNPFGLWRALPPGDVGLAVREPEPMVMPPLLTSLAMKEQQLDRPLDEAEVREIVDQAVVIELDLADARAMEQARGFADLNPRRAWEQWEQLRTQTN